MAIGASTRYASFLSIGGHRLIRAMLSWLARSSRHLKGSIWTKCTMEFSRTPISGISKRPISQPTPWFRKVPRKRCPFQRAESEISKTSPSSRCDICVSVRPWTQLK
ncbi:hypothetical protein D9M68_1005840 [compost metagenome]